MKILHAVQFYDPSVGGMQEVVKQLSERLSKMGHQVTVATSYDAGRQVSRLGYVEIVSFRISGNAVEGIEGDEVEIQRYQDFLRGVDFDVITFFAAQQWATDLALPILRQIRAKKVFVPTGFSGLFIPRYADYYEQMKEVMTQFDMNVFLSDDYRDIRFARDNGIERVTLIPNGAGADEFMDSDLPDIRRILGISADTFLVLLVGSHTGLKGHREAIEIFRRARISKAVLLIVGNYFDACRRTDRPVRIVKRVKQWVKRMFQFVGILRVNCPDLCRGIERRFNRSIWRQWDHNRICVRLLDRKETVAAYHQADIFLFPSEIECSPIVLFECMASRTPFLVTDVGNSAEIISWSGAGELLPTDRGEDGYSHAKIRESVNIFENLIYNRNRRIAMAEAGYQAWRARFSWEVISQRYEALYRDLIHS